MYCLMLSKTLGCKEAQDAGKKECFDYKLLHNKHAALLALLFNMLSRLVIAFLPRSKRLLIS